MQAEGPRSRQTGPLAPFEDLFPLASSRLFRELSDRLDDRGSGKVRRVLAARGLLLRLHLLVDNVHLRMLLAREWIQRVDRFSDCVMAAAKQRMNSAIG